MDVLKKYRVFCNTENTHFETWRTTKPIVCPNDYRHTIDPSQTVEIDRQVIETANTQQVYIHAKSFQQTNGFYMVQGRKYTIPDSNEEFIEDFILPIPHCIYGFKVGTSTEHIGDKFSIKINPDTPVGVTTQAASSNETVLVVSDTVTHNCIPGFYLNINGTEHLITAKNVESNTITIAPPLQVDVGAYTPLLLNLYIVKDFEIQTAGSVDVGYGSMGGKTMPTGSVIRLHYHNCHCTNKSFTINYEYTY